MKKNIIFFILIFIITLGLILIAFRNTKETFPQNLTNNVEVSDGKQVITINAKGGYAPKVTSAKADMPTTLKIKTSGTFDCSSSITIPSLKYRTNLPATGETEVAIPPQATGSSLHGLCSMGMYSFTLYFN